MSTGWAEDFSYGYYVRILEAAKSRFGLRLLGAGLDTSGTLPVLFIRHDVDVSIRRALSMGEIEADHEVRSTYMVMPSSKMYSLQSSRRALRRLIELNHEVGLHFDVDAKRREPQTAVPDVIAEIDDQCRIIADVVGEPVRSISFHRPMTQFLRGDLHIAGRINAYAAELMESYVSDSRGTWRAGDPLLSLQGANVRHVQLLVHPIWWGTRHLTAEERLEEFFLEETARLAAPDRASFDADLARTLPGVRRSTFTEV